MTALEPLDLPHTQFLGFLSPARKCRVWRTIFTVLHVMHTRYSDENSVRPSVCPSHAWIVTKQENDLSRFLHYAKDNLA